MMLRTCIGLSTLLAVSGCQSMLDSQKLGFALDVDQHPACSLRQVVVLGHAGEPIPDKCALGDGLHQKAYADGKQLAELENSLARARSKLYWHRIRTERAEEAIVAAERHVISELGHGVVEGSSQDHLAKLQAESSELQESLARYQSIADSAATELAEWQSQLSIAYR